ncbi:MAG TPA: GTPase HflX [Clostridiales bacterium]|nr:GTPase HflX [Clostridiales bacterium]
MGELYGDILSIGKSQINAIKALYDYRMDYNQFASLELLEEMSRLSHEINKEIAVYINRRGIINSVSVGTEQTAPLPKPEGRKSLTATNGIRCVHTHPNASSQLSQIDLNALYTMNFDAMAAVSVKEGKPGSVTVALPSELYLSFDVAQDELVKSIQSIGKSHIYGPYPFYDKASLDQLMLTIRENDRLLKKDVFETAGTDDRAILIAIETPETKTIAGRSEAEISLDELEELTYTAGGIVLEKINQKRPKRDPAYMIGKGKLEEIALLRQSIGANLLIFDNELTGTQVRNIQKVTGARVLDRTNLILDIFAGRAKSKEGKLQVELAQLKYTMPQLLGLGQELSQQGGGIGTRGPGETMLETDRRHVLRRITSLEKQLKAVKKQRVVAHRSRERSSLPIFALVGYTNAGKSTLLNKICNADVFTEDKLFATLDPSTRMFELKTGQYATNALMTDTVGFIRNLPHHLVEAFKSTLEEVLYADVVLHVVDASDPMSSDKILVAEKILRDLGASATPSILVLNKSDLPGSSNRYISLGERAPWVEVSAVTGEGIDQLLSVMAEMVTDKTVSENLILSYKNAGFASFIRKHALSVEENFTDVGIEIAYEAYQSAANQIKAQYENLIAQQ